MDFTVLSLTCCLTWGLRSQQKDQQFLTRLTPPVISCSPSCLVCCWGGCCIFPNTHTAMSFRSQLTPHTPFKHACCLRMVLCSPQKKKTFGNETTAWPKLGTEKKTAALVVMRLFVETKACLKKKKKTLYTHFLFY